MINFQTLTLITDMIRSKKSDTEIINELEKSGYDNNYATMCVNSTKKSINYKINDNV
jgi:hypothetical protein